jgi:hypothetical protein
MTPVGFEPKISAGELPQTYALDHAATGIDFRLLRELNKTLYVFVACDSWENEDAHEEARVAREYWVCYSITTRIYS